MSIHMAEGVVLRRQEIRETSLMLTVFTRQLGKIQGLVKGVRGARAAVPWYLEPLTLQSLVVYERRRSAWALIGSCDLQEAFDPVRRDFGRTASALYALDLVDSLTGVGDPHPDIFALLLDVLHALGRGSEVRSPLRYLEGHLLRISGLLPEPDSLRFSPPARAAWDSLLGAGSAGEVSLPPAVEQELRLKLLAILRGIHGKDLRSRSFLQALGLENGAK